MQEKLFVQEHSFFLRFKQRRMIEKVQQTKAKVIQHLINRRVGAATQTTVEWASGNSVSYMVLIDDDG